MILTLFLIQERGGLKTSLKNLHCLFIVIQLGAKQVNEMVGIIPMVAVNLLAIASLTRAHLKCSLDAKDLSSRMLNSIIARGQGLAGSGAATSTIELGIFQQVSLEPIVLGILAHLAAIGSTGEHRVLAECNSAVCLGRVSQE